MERSRRERIIEQPCYGCILFNECGSVTRISPNNCKKRMTVEEYGHIPSKEQIEVYKSKFNE